MEYNFKNDYEEAIHIEEYEAYTQNEEYNNIKKYNQNIYDILNHKKNDDSSDNDTDDTDDDSSINETDDE